MARPGDAAREDEEHMVTEEEGEEREREQREGIRGRGGRER
jgi:hypothetical protein